MLVRKLDRFVFDVFLGNGFDNWTRVRKYHWGYKVVGGNWLPNNLMKEVSIAINSNPNGLLGNV